MRRLLLTGLAAALLMAPAPAGAAIIQDFGEFQSGTNGIVLGPDGNFWVAEEFNGTVARMTPSGQVINRYPVGPQPTSLAAGPGGRVWVTVPGDAKLAWFDATSATPTRHDVFTPNPLCQPIAVAAGNGRVYYSAPSCDALGHVLDDGSGPVTQTNVGGDVFDLAVASGFVFAPIYNAGTVQRRTATLADSGSINVPNNPDGVVVDGAGRVWVSENSGGRLARFAQSLVGGVQEITPTGGPLTGAFDLVHAADGSIWVTGTQSANLVRVLPDGTFRFYDTGGQPQQIVNGPDGFLYFTDRAHSRVRRLLSTAPRATTGAAAGVSATSASVNASVDSRGAATTVVFDYGPTTAYGATATVSIPAAVGPAPVSAVLAGLAPGTTYHYRVRASNEEGHAAGTDTTFTTLTGDGDGDGVAPPLDCNDANAAIRPGAVDRPGDRIDQDCSGADAAFARLAARAGFSWRFRGARTVLTKVEVSDLAGGETVRVTCTGRGCPLKSKTYRNVKRGKRSLTSLFGRRKPLRTGTKVVVRITKADSIGSTATLTVGKRQKDPRITRRRVNP